jgi:hypothetical protein
MDNTQGRDSASFLEDMSQSENLSEFNQPLTATICKHLQSNFISFVHFKKVETDFFRQ